MLHTTSTTVPSFSGEGQRAVVAGDTVRSGAEHSLRCVLEPICLNYTNFERLCFCRDSTWGIYCFSYWLLFKYITSSYFPGMWELRKIHFFFNRAKTRSFLSPVAVTSRKLSEICKRMSHDMYKVSSDVDSYQQWWFFNHFHMLRKSFLTSWQNIYIYIFFLSWIMNRGTI